MEGEKGRQRLTIVGSAPTHGFIIFLWEEIKMNKYEHRNLQYKVDKLMKENENLLCELKRMQEKNARLEKENSDIQNSHMKLYNDTKDEIRELKSEIERLRQKCGETPCECSRGNEEIKLPIEALVYDFQDQHQQDCIQYNDMRTAFLKAVDELALLRKQFGVGQ